MGKYDLRFSIGLESGSAKAFKQQLDNLTQPRSIPIKLNLKEYNTFKNVLSAGLETTVKFHVDLGELQRAVDKFGIHDITTPITTDSFISQQTISSTEKRISQYSKLIDSFLAKEKEVKKAYTKIMDVAGISGKKYNEDAYNQTLKSYQSQLKEARYSNPEAIPQIKAQIDKLKSMRAEFYALTSDYDNLAKRILSSISAIENDPYITKEFTDEIKKRRFRSSSAFLKSMQTKSAGKFVPEDLSNAAPDIVNPQNVDNVKNLTNAMKTARTELRAFIEDNKIGVGKNGLIQGIAELDGNKLSQVNRIIETAETIRTKYQEATGRFMNIGTQKNEGVIIQALKSRLASMTDQMNTVIGTLNYETEKTGSSVTTSAAAKLSDDLSRGLSNIPINSFAVSPEAIEAVRGQIQAQLANVTIGKTITLTQNKDEKSVEDRVVLPNVIIGSFELSEDAIVKLRADTQRALNNVTLEPSADEAAFSEAFEKVAKAYQNKLNTLGRKLNHAIEKPVIEEFDAKPAIEKMKAQITEALSSFKFDINGKVAHGTISTGTDELGRAAYKTYESLESGVKGLTSTVTGNIAKLTTMGTSGDAEAMIAQYNTLLEKIETFKKEFRQTDSDGKLVITLEDANKQMAELTQQAHTLGDAFDEIATKNSIDKALKNTADKIRNTVAELNKYQQTDEMKAVRVRLIGEEGNGGILNQVEALRSALPTQTISDSNIEMTRLLTLIEEVNQEFSRVSADTPLIRTLERAGSEAERAQKAVLNLQEQMQKALTANSRGFSMPEYRSRYNDIYNALTSGNLGTHEVDALRTSFKALMNDMRAAGVTGKSFGDVMRGMYAKFGSWTMVTMTIQRVISTFKRMVSAVQEVDSALTNLRKVTDATEADLERFMRGVGNSAHKLGASMSDLVNATAEFSRLGYDLNQSQKLGELATMYKSVAEDLDITTASQSIVSTLKAFEKAGISAERIVDVFNYVGNNFAISSAGIGEAMQRSAASLQAANNSLEQSVALITAANTVAQDPIKVGTAMKTLSARIRGSKTELVELGEDIEFLAEGTSKLRGEIQSLSGVDIMIDKNNFKSTYQIIDELSTAYQGMVETSQARLAELLGGKNQANIVSALLENFDVARKTLKDSTESADGSAAKELETSLDSINGKVNQLSATWQKLSTDVLESDGFKAIISGADNLLKILDKLIGGSNTLIKLAPMVLAGFGIAKGKTGLGEPKNQRVLIICPEFMSYINNRLCVA